MLIVSTELSTERHPIVHRQHNRLIYLFQPLSAPSGLSTPFLVHQYPHVSTPPEIKVTLGLIDSFAVFSHFRNSRRFFLAAIEISLT